MAHHHNEEEASFGPHALRLARRFIPRECFEKSDRKASKYLGQILVLLLLAQLLAFAIWTSGWWLLSPVAWLCSGTLLTSLFMITHDCGHHAFFRSRKLNWVVGTAAAAAVLYPFTQWKLWHDAHHRRNNLEGQTVIDQMRRPISFQHDTAFVPETTTGLHANPKRGVYWWAYIASRRFPSLTAALIPAALIVFFPLWGKRHRDRGLFSLCYLFLFVGAVAGGLLHATGSWWSVCFFWLAPLVVHSCWLAYYTLNQHTGQDAPILAADDWTPLRGQVLGTYNAHVPAVVSWLHGGQDYHVVHHVSPSIPSYHLKEANEGLLQSPLGELVRTRLFSPRRYFRIQRTCQVWDTQKRRYITLREWSMHPPSSEDEESGLRLSGAEANV